MDYLRLIICVLLTVNHDKINHMTAPQARKMTDDATAITILKVIEVIKSAAEDGHYHVMIPMYDKAIAAELISLGYKLDHDNENILVSWM